jgi:hypothetical protein
MPTVYSIKIKIFTTHKLVIEIRVNPLVERFLLARRYEKLGCDFFETNTTWATGWSLPEVYIVSVRHLGRMFTTNPGFQGQRHLHPACLRLDHNNLTSLLIPFELDIGSTDVRCGRNEALRTFSCQVERATYYIQLHASVTNRRQQRQGKMYIGTLKVALQHPETISVSKKLIYTYNMRFTLGTLTLIAAFIVGTSAAALPDAGVEARFCLASATACWSAADCCSRSCGLFLPGIHFDVSTCRLCIGEARRS